MQHIYALITETRVSCCFASSHLNFSLDFNQNLCVFLCISKTQKVFNCKGEEKGLKQGFMKIYLKNEVNNYNHSFFSLKHLYKIIWIWIQYESTGP